MSWGDYESSTTRALRSIDSAKYNKDFVQNIQSLNYATDFMADYMTVMQTGIDNANKDIIQKIQDFIEDLIIIFGGGDTGDSGFNWGDLKYIIQAIGALFGFGGSGPVNLLDAAGHLLTNFGGAAINGFIDGFVSFLIGLVEGIPLIGQPLANALAGLINQKASKQETSNVSAIFDCENADYRTAFPSVASMWSYANTGGFAHNGTWYLKLAPTAGYAGFSKMVIGIKTATTPNEKIQFDWWQRRESASFPAALIVQYYDSAGTFVSDGMPTVIPDNTADNSVWVNYRSQITVPSGVAAFVPSVKLNLAGGGSPTGYWVFDDMVTRRAPDPNVQQVPVQSLAVSIDPNEQTTISRSSLMYGAASSTSSAGSSTASAHSHPLSQIPQYVPSGGGNDMLELGYIRILQNKILTQVGFGTGGSNTFAGIAAARLGIYKMDPITGDLTLMTPALATTDIKASVTTQNKEFRFGLGLKMNSLQGDVFAVGMCQQTGFGQNCASLLCQTVTSVTNPSSQFPRRLYGYVDLTSASGVLPSTISEASINYGASNKIPFYVLQ
jgi:hypothetical protein